MGWSRSLRDGSVSITSVPSIAVWDIGKQSGYSWGGCVQKLPFHRFLSVAAKPTSAMQPVSTPAKSNASKRVKVSGVAVCSVKYFHGSIRVVSMVISFWS
jgi:hypothetical protein